MGKEYYGFDVSQWNGAVDMAAAKSGGNDFAIIRSSYGNVIAYPKQVDTQFYNNVSKAKAAGLDFGVYHYSYATDEAGAQTEARGFVQLLDKIKPIPYFVALDIEDATQAGLSNGTLQGIIKAFIDVVEDAGYFCALYSYEAFLSRLSGDFRSHYAIWCANTVRNPSIKYGVHQYTFTGSVDGINGAVDLNRGVVDYASCIKSGGFNGYIAPAPDKELDKAADKDIIKRGDHGLAVYELKRRLLAKGCKVDDSDGFGGGTEKAVNKFLAEWGFIQNGIVGKNFADRIMK